MLLLFVIVIYFSYLLVEVNGMYVMLLYIPSFILLLSIDCLLVIIIYMFGIMYFSCYLLVGPNMCALYLYVFVV